MRILFCFATAILLFAAAPVLAQDKGINLGDKLPALGNGGVNQPQLPAGVLPWYNRMRGNNKGPINPAAALQAQQQQAQTAMFRQQAALAAKKAAEKQRKKEQKNAVNAKKRAEELAERGTAAKP